MAEFQLIKDVRPVADIVTSAVEAIEGGYIDPVQAYFELSRFGKAVEQIKANERVKELTLAEIAKYGRKGATIGDMILTESEAGVKYDYSVCNCSRLMAMYKMRDDLNADIKELERALRALPASGMADPETGELLMPPVKTSTTIIKCSTIKQ